MAARESNSWLIDQAVKEYEALQAGTLDVFANSTAAPGGVIEYCGREDDLAHWTAAYVRAEDGALLPLAAGPLERVLVNVTRIDRADTPIWDPQVLPPPVIVVDGARQHFRPARGRFLIGAVTTERRAVLLSAIGETLVVVHLRGKSTAVLFCGGPFSFREIDVDALLAARRGTDETVPKPKVIRLSSFIRSQHDRIIGRLPVDVGDGPAIPEVLWRCFGDLRRRAAAVPLAHPKQKRKGKTRVEEVVHALYEAGLVGCGDFEGLSGEILAQLKVFCPDLKIRAEVFADVLRLLLAANTCIIEHPSGRSWRIRLVGLNDPRSPLHRQFCKETVTLYKHETSRAMLPAKLPTGSTEPTTNASPADRADPRTNAPPSPPTNASPTTLAPSQPDLEIAGHVLPGPAAALAVLLLAMQATAQAEARAQAIARAILQVENEERLTELAVAAAVSARLAPQVAEAAAEMLAAAAPPAKDPREVRTSHAPSENSVPRARVRPLRPLAVMSCLASPPVGRARPALTGLPRVALPPSDPEPAHRWTIRNDVSEVDDALETTHRSPILGLLGARGPPLSGVEPSQR